MFSGAKSRQIAYNNVSLIENVKILGSREKGSLGIKTELEVWEIDTEISFNSKLFQIVFHVVFPSQFPLEFPKIYLSPETFERTKFIPHIDNNRLVCTYDTEVVTTNPEEPGGIVIECIKKSKNIILDGLSGSNHFDFNDEFRAYWEAKYGHEKYLPQNVLSLINKVEPEAKLKLICLRNYLGVYKYVLHDSNEVSIRFKSSLGKKEYSEVDVYYLEDFPLTMPPFELKNQDILTFVKSTGVESLRKFKKFINSGVFPKLVVCEKIYEEKVYVFGWFHKHIETNVNGFRPGVLKPFVAFSTIQSNQKVNRVTTDVLTKERLENRTSGIKTPENEKLFLIAGVGSIGSNLVYFLNSINSPEFRLVDGENLWLENIQRHLLGFEYIGSYKTIAIRDFLLKNNPIQKITTRESSIVDVVKIEESFINDVDYIFVAIGKSNIDNWVCQSVRDGIITKPVFILWVEPYLCGGHCLYLHPTNPSFEEYFEDGFFKYNVIKNEEYKSGKANISLREAGCQTTYIPYSGTNVISFLSSLFPFICAIIDFKKMESTSFSWVGNLDVLNKKGIKISDFYLDKIEGEIIEHTI